MLGDSVHLNQDNQQEPESFEQAIQELEFLVAKMDTSSLGLDSLLSDYKRGALLVKFCRSRLQTVKNELQIIDNELSSSADQG